MQSLDLKIQDNKKQQIFYKENIIGELTFDIVVNNAVIIKIDNQKDSIQAQQLELAKNFLKLTDFEVLLFLNFGVELEHRRILLTNDFKKWN